MQLQSYTIEEKQWLLDFSNSLVDKWNKNFIGPEILNDWAIFFKGMGRITRRMWFQERYGRAYEMINSIPQFTELSFVDQCKLKEQNLSSLVNLLLIRSAQTVTFEQNIGTQDQNIWVSISKSVSKINMFHFL